MKTLKDFLNDDERRSLVRTDQDAFGAYCHVAFFLQYIGAIVYEKGSDKVQFKYRRGNEDTIFVTTIDPEKAELVSEHPLAIGKTEQGSGSALYYNNQDRHSDYQIAERQLKMVGLS